MSLDFSLESYRGKRRNGQGSPNPTAPQVLKLYATGETEMH